jgi:hypothetical protein
VYAPNHPHQCGRHYVYEHILIWEALGGPLPEGYGIHHRNGDKQDNRFENLEAMSRPEHATLHHELRKIERVALKKDECVVVEIEEIA